MQTLLHFCMLRLAIIFLGVMFALGLTVPSFAQSVDVATVVTDGDSYVPDDGDDC